MVIIGAGGFAKELLQIFIQNNEVEHLAFYDDVNPGITELYGRFPVLKNTSRVRSFFEETDNRFTIGIGNPALRYTMYKKFADLGGILTSVISPRAFISSYDVTIQDGCNILDGATFSNSSGAGKACIVYYSAIVTHDCYLGDFVQLSPGATILGGAKIGGFSVVGANATVLPKLNVGKYTMIGAASVITKDVPDHALMVGNPARKVGWVSRYGEKLIFDDHTQEAICRYSGEKYRLEGDNVVLLT